MRSMGVYSFCWNKNDYYLGEWSLEVTYSPVDGPESMNTWHDPSFYGL